MWLLRNYHPGRRIKEQCYLADSFQVDDPFSTFTCASKTGLNSVNYKVDFCPNAASAGINPPVPKTCTPSVPDAYDADQYTLGLGSDYTVAVNKCDAQGDNCTTSISPNPSGSVIFKAGATSAIYQFKVTNPAGDSSQTCRFTVPSTACITRVGSTPDCSTWHVAPDGVWKGRSIQVPAF